MIRGHVERFEVVVVVFDLGALEDLIAEPREDLDHFIANQAERMPITELRHAAGQRDVDGVGRTRVTASSASRSASASSTIALELVDALPSVFLDCSGAAVFSASMKAAIQPFLRPSHALRSAWNSALGTHLGQLVAEHVPRAIWTRLM